jgi:aspyridone synthetase (hybrid polyketide synthase/nonribosomal peptide synthetase)
MGRELMKQSPLFHSSLKKCERVLSRLSDGPSWSLTAEIETSRTASSDFSAEVCQPLCTAIQIALIDLLRECGVNFSVVVGHSSGEIAAAYAAGILDTKDAMGIAYYRGSAACLATDSEGQPGKMMAAEMSLDRAKLLCAKFPGQLAIAAWNSPTSVTLSGDSDAIKKTSEMLSAENTFARVLPVNVAYHSHHMSRCADMYMEHLKRLKIVPKPGFANCVWFSSVEGYGQPLLESMEFLSHQYWVDNMVKPVHFCGAVTSTLKHNPSYALALEVGPHPALRLAFKDIVKSVEKTEMPYTGCLHRLRDDIDAMSSALGYLWQHLGPSQVSLEGWRKALNLNNKPKAIKGLPSYVWDHDHIYWHQTRIAKAYRGDRRSQNQLLGRLYEESDDSIVWRNVFSQKDVPWSKGHKFQEQIVLPGAAYVSMAVEAAHFVTTNRDATMVEIRDFNILRALVIPEDGEKVETVFKLHTSRSTNNQNLASPLEAEFCCYKSSKGDRLEKTCQGQLFIYGGIDAGFQFSSIAPHTEELPPLGKTQFYAVMDNIGISYDGPFRMLDSIQRAWGMSKASATWACNDLSKGYILHPAILDAAFQNAFATFFTRAEGAMSALLPVGARRIIVDPGQRYISSSCKTHTSFQSHLVNATGVECEVDISLYNSSTKKLGVQVDGLILKAVGDSWHNKERALFAKTVFNFDVASGLPAPSCPTRVTEEELEYTDAVERTALFYLNNLRREMAGETSDMKQHHKALLSGVDAILEPISRGKNSVVRKEWLDDTREVIQAFVKQYGDSVDLALLAAVGENICSVVRGESEMLEHMVKDNLLGKLYSHGRGFAACNEQVADYISKIIHKHARPRILELGAGTGGTTNSVLNVIRNNFSSYTYTDISAGFFGEAARRFASHASQMEFKILNLELNPLEQGFSPASYDIIIAANVLHATSRLSQTLHHVRDLLRPGGFLIAVEVTGSMLREPGLMGGLSGWWLGAQDGRFPSPGVSANQWDSILSEHGFSGIDSIFYDCADVERHNCSTFVTRAMDEYTSALCDPVGSVTQFPEGRILIVGGNSLPVKKLVSRAESILRNMPQSISICRSFDSMDTAKIDQGTSILCFTELDKPIFKSPIDPLVLKNIQKALSKATNVLWVTSGRLGCDPYQNMMVGVGRSLAAELPDLRLQFLDFAAASTWSADKAVHHLLQLILLSSVSFASHDMLWVLEPEVLLEGETTLIPRVLPDHAVNAKMNAAYHEISRLADSEDIIEISRRDDTVSLILSEEPLQHEHTEELNLQFSVALHSTPENALYLCYGQLLRNGHSALALSAKEASLIMASADNVYEPMPACRHVPETLVRTGSLLIASHILDSSPNDGTIVLYEPNIDVADAMDTLASPARRKVMFISSATDNTPLGWIHIHTFLQRRMIRLKMPPDMSIFWVLSESGAKNIETSLPPSCTIMRLNPHDISPRKENIDKVFQMVSDPKRMVPIFGLDSASSSHKEGRLSAVQAWERKTPLNISVPPARPRNIFSPRKTYILAGMTGELGQSLCRFMLASGARYIVQASRDPTTKSTPKFEEISGIVDVCVIRMDITDRAKVAEVASIIRQTMPPIGGVVNGALVLIDSLFINTTVGMVEEQIGPKVQGTINLDEEFRRDDLDFFIALSSLASELGNAGQSIYHAANLFMAGLVEKRRRRGQAASIIDIGMIADVGYVARNLRANGNIEGHLQSQSYTSLTEPEFHHAFVQAVEYGTPGSENARVIFGLQPYLGTARSFSPPWTTNVRFCHMISASDPSKKPNKSSESTELELQHLDSVSSREDVAKVLSEKLCKKIGDMMRLPAAAIGTQEPLTNLGLDSLLAVGIRTWLLKNFGIKIPLLAILGQETVSSLSGRVADEFIQRLNLNDTPKPGEICQEDGSLGFAKGGNSTLPKTLAPSLPSTDTASEEGTTLSTGATTPSEQLPESEPNDYSLYILQDNEKAAQDSATLAAQSSTNSVVHESAFMRTECLSFPQMSMYFVLQLLEDTTAFNVVAHYTVKGHFKVSRFRKALETTLGHHDVYRTSFFKRSGAFDILQGVLPKMRDFRFDHLHSANKEHTQQIFESFSNHSWDLANGETFGSAVITHAPDTHSLIFGCHHIIMDGMSWDIFLRDLDFAYQSVPLPTQSRSYLDFCHAQSLAANDGSYEMALQYWHEHLKGVSPGLPLLSFARRRNRPAQNNYSNVRVQRTLNLDTVRKVKETCRLCRVTPMAFYLSVMGIIFARLLDVEDIPIGVIDAGRGGSDAYMETIGHFANMLPLRLRMRHQDDFTAILNNTSRAVLDGLEHCEVPIDEILKSLGIERSNREAPLIQLAFNYRVGKLLQRQLGTCSIELANYRDARTPYDFAFNFTQITSDSHLIEIVSNSDLYSRDVTEMIMEIYVNTLENLSQNQSHTLQDCAMFSEHQLMAAANLGCGGKVDYEWPKTLAERFLQVSTKFPHSIAMKHGSDSVRYDQLNERVGRIANILMRRGIRARHHVAVLCEPSIDMYSAMLGIFHIGAVYIPIDITLPAPRVRSLLEVCKPDILLFHAATAGKARADLYTSLCVGLLEISNLNSTAELPPIHFSDDYDLVLFTSGTTGKPKGVKLTQEGIMNYAAAKSAGLQLGQVKVLQQSSPGFDMSIAQVFNAFANAGTLVIVPQQSRADPARIASLMLQESVELTISTPTEYLLLADYALTSLRKCSSWRYACAGGEAITASLVSRLQRTNLYALRLVDCYGPTEASCASTYKVWKLDDECLFFDKPCSVGRPIPNTFVRILDAMQKPLPVGFSGEICIGGHGVTRGYLSSATGSISTNFVRDPETQTNIYRTGDKGCLLADGSLLLLGRIEGDTLVKLRGLRIELTEVSEALLQAGKGSISDAVVTVRGDPQFLVAHVVSSGRKHLTQAELNQLSASLPLPRYMIPSVMILLDSLPVTQNGKLDRKVIQQLPLPESSLGVPDQEPLTVVEGEVCNMWKRVIGDALGKTLIQADSDFFAVGGSSLLLLQLQSSLKDKMGVSVDLPQLYMASTLRKMAMLVDIGRSQLVPNIVNWGEETSVPEALHIRANSGHTKLQKPQREVLLTGATGFLGSYILKSLVAQVEITKVHCIAIPTGSEDKITTHPKVRTYHGSLLDSALGLTPDDITYIRDNVDQIIHAGAQGHCLNNYFSVRHANYLSTQFLADLALSRGVPFHFVSSSRVILLSGSCSVPPKSMSAYAPPTDGSQGFTASKWASEVFLENLAHRTGLPVVIHRPCSLTGDAAPEDDALNSVVRYSILSRTVPDVPNADGYFDFKDVREVAEDIVAGQAGNNPVTFLHHSSGAKVPFRDLAARMKDLHGGEFKTVSLSEWIGTASKLGMEYLIVSYLKANVEGAGKLTFPYLGQPS